MAELRNFTPFPNMQFANWDAQGREFGVFMVKVAWDISENGDCTLSEEQEPFHFTDQFADAPNSSPPLYASDLVPYKPQTDIILNATTYPPGGQPATEWHAQLRAVDDINNATLIDKKLTITGPRQWIPRWHGWKLSAPAKASAVDLRYDKAFGGVIPQGEDDKGAPILKAWEYNPVGCGWADRKHTSAEHPLEAPQILLTDQSLQDPHTTLPPAGFGPVQAAWLPRRPRGGTYDRAWEENVWPGYPADYDFAFHNAASDGMTCDLPMGAGVLLTMTHLHPTQDIWEVKLPYPPIVAYLEMGSRVVPTAMMLDTVHLDIDAAHSNDMRAYTVLRLVFDRLSVKGIVLGGRKANMQLSDLYAPPHPHDVAQYIPEEDAEIPQFDEETGEEVTA